MDQMPISVRVLPMTSKIAEEFPDCSSIQDVQEKFFLSDLPFRPDCSYLHGRNGLDASSGTVVLFQCQGHIIASATYLGSERFDQPDPDGYMGQLFFDPTSIRTFNPINADGIRQIWPTFKRFGQSPLHLSSEGYPAFVSQLEDVKVPSVMPPTFPTDGSATVGPSEPSAHWTDAEYKATVEAYLWMLGQEQHGSTYNKSKVNSDLRSGPLAARTKPSVEFRMRNISAVLEDLCLPWIKGYLPAGNVRGEGREKIKLYLANAGAYTPEDYAPTENPEDFEEKVRTLRTKIKPTGIPTGQRTPKQTSTTSVGFARDPLVKAWVLENAKGICEGCGEPAPFMKSTGEPFLEHHHLKQLGEQGTDTITNSIAACPNCHRRCHHSSDKGVFIDSIYVKVSRLVRE